MDSQDPSTDDLSLTYANESVNRNDSTVFNLLSELICSNCSETTSPPTGQFTTPIARRLTWRDVLEPQFFELVPEHWLQFEPPSNKDHVALGFLYIIIIIPAMLGNGMIIWLYCTSKPLRTPSNILVVNLALSDLFMSAKMPIFIYNSFNYGPVTGSWACQVYGFVGGFSGTCAIMTIAAMSAERYVSISRPLNPVSRMTTTRAVVIAVFIWIYSLIFSSAPLFGLNRYVPEGYLTSCSFDYLSSDFSSRVFVVVYFVAAFCFPLVVISYSYCGIVVAVRKSDRHFRSSYQSRRPIQDGAKSSHRKKELKLAKLAFTLISIWVISWTPYATVALMGIFSDRKRLTPMTSMIPALFAKTSSVFNPFVYSLTHPRFKIEINRRFFWWNAARNSIRNRLSLHSSASRSYGEPGDKEDEAGDEMSGYENNPDDGDGVHTTRTTTLSILRQEIEQKEKVVDGPHRVTDQFTLESEQLVTHSFRDDGDGDKKEFVFTIYQPETKPAIRRSF